MTTAQPTPRLSRPSLCDNPTQTNPSPADYPRHRRLGPPHLLPTSRLVPNRARPYPDCPPPPVSARPDPVRLPTPLHVSAPQPATTAQPCSARFKPTLPRTDNPTRPVPARHRPNLPDPAHSDNPTRRVPFLPFRLPESDRQS